MKDRQLALLFLGTRQIFKNISKKKKDFNIHSAAQLEALCFIKNKEKSTMKEISEYMRVSAPSATSMIDILVKKRELERVSDKRDRRRVVLKVTEKGEKKLNSSMSFLLKEIEDAFSILSKKDKQDFERILRKIEKNY